MRGDIGPLGWRVEGFHVEKRDLWLGVYWTRVMPPLPAIKVYVCVIPMLPLVMYFDWRPVPTEEPAP